MARPRLGRLQHADRPRPPRRQVFALNNCYSYKNAISNGLYFNLAARLAWYTGDESYALHAAETFDWMLRVGLITGTPSMSSTAHTSSTVAVTSTAPSSAIM